MRFKSIFVTLICLLLVFVLIGCSSGNGQGEVNEPQDVSENDKENQNTQNDENANPSEQSKEEVKKMASRKSFKLLCVGNSFSDNALNYAYSILNSFGVQEIVLGNLYIGGCTIDQHVENAATDAPNYIYRKNTSGAFVSSNGTKMSTALKDEDWDYITMQQASGSSGMINTYGAKVKALNNFLRDSLKNEKLKLGWIMTWAYQQNSNHEEFVKYNKDQLTMYEMITNCVKEKILTNDKFDFIVPAGTAIQNARTSYLADSLTSDGYHLEDLGEFIAGITLILEITNWDMDDMNYDLIPQKFIPYLDVVKESVVNALEKPFEVSASTNQVNPITSRVKGEFTTQRNISYSDASQDCKLDMYLPKESSFDIIVHFHGGGLNSGAKDDGAHVVIGTTVAQSGIGYVSANYRMYPVNKYPDFFEDGAAAVKYVKDYMSENNINGKLYVSGQSAGAYIAMMLCFNPQYLQNVGMKVTDVDGWIIEAGQPTTHFNVLGADGLDTQLQRIDEKAPLYYVNNQTRFKNLLLITYTNDIACRESQTRLTYDTIKNFNPNAKVELRVYEGNHCINSTTPYRGFYIHAQIMIDFINRK